ncbi:MAG: T9SS type A sorting domain-containing protein [Chitinophagaceae bacterium]|nr:MAG: T9SS type A sorting domain-containing protein [Chitinophagaceae bacterium]
MMRFFKRPLLFVAFLTNLNLISHAQVAGVSDIGVGYFNGHQFASFGTISGNTLTGALGSNTFSINFSANTKSVYQIVAGYGPSRPANSGTFSTACMELNFSAAPATSTIVFSSVLQPMDAFHAIDIENGESVTFEFLDVSNNPVTIAGNVKVVSLSTITPTASLNYPSASMVGINTTPGRITTGNADQGFSFVMLTNVVKTIRFIQVNPNTGAGSWDFTMSKGSPDRGDAPASYGNALHLSLAALKFGLNAGDGDGTAFTGTAANGDDAVVGSTEVDDDDGIASVPAVTNTGAVGQVIPTYSVSATVSNATGVNAGVMAWVDWNGDGTFGSTEAATAAAVPTGSVNVSRTFTWTNVTLGGSVGRAGTYLRLRTSTDVIAATNAAGFLSNGEAEDYLVPFAITLPVQLRDFNAVRTTDKKVLLEWETDNEENNTGFSVEHSGDGQAWKEIGFIPTAASNGNSQTLLRYRYIHQQPTTGINYYRLKQADRDGRASFSEVRSVEMEPGTTITVTPNPATDVVTVSGLNQGDIVVLYNLNGQPLINRKAAGTQLRLDIGRFAKGFYTITVNPANSGAPNFRILKK